MGEESYVIRTYRKDPLVMRSPETPSHLLSGASTRPGENTETRAD